MQALTSPKEIRRLLEAHGFTFQKRLGQNFIINPGICPRIAQLGGVDENTGVLEIGPGIGTLTRELCARARRVVAVEVDRRLPPLLKETLAGCDNVQIVEADVLELDLHALLRREFAGMEVVVCANLPYYITSPILMKLLEERLPVRAVTVMVQKEAAGRICAPLPSRAAGALTVAVRYYSEPRILFEVSPGSFLPAPDVQSAVIRLDLHPSPPVDPGDEAVFFRTVRAAFGQRRKTLPNALSAGLSLPKDEILPLLERAGIPPAARAEQLSLEQFAAMARELGSADCSG